MPSVSVPLKGEKGWSILMKQRRDFWNAAGHSRLSPHFKAQEFYCNDGSACPTSARSAMVKLCDVFLERMRARFGTAQVLSGYRHTVYNAMIGGARQSQHIYEHGFEAVAADLRFPKGSPQEWAAYAKGIRATHNHGRGGVGRYDRAGFVHIDNRLYAADWSG